MDFAIFAITRPPITRPPDHSALTDGSGCPGGEARSPVPVPRARRAGPADRAGRGGWRNFRPSVHVACRRGDRRDACPLQQPAGFQRRNLRGLLRRRRRSGPPARRSRRTLVASVRLRPNCCPSGDAAIQLERAVAWFRAPKLIHRSRSTDRDGRTHRLRGLDLAGPTGSRDGRPRGDRQLPATGSVNRRARRAGGGSARNRFRRHRRAA